MQLRLAIVMNPLPLALPHGNGDDDNAAGAGARAGVSLLELPAVSLSLVGRSIGSAGADVLPASVAPLAP